MVVHSHKYLWTLWSKAAALGRLTGNLNSMYVSGAISGNMIFLSFSSTIRGNVSCAFPIDTVICCSAPRIKLERASISNIELEEKWFSLVEMEKVRANSSIPPNTGCALKSTEDSDSSTRSLHDFWTAFGTSYEKWSLPRLISTMVGEYSPGILDLLHSSWVHDIPGTSSKPDISNIISIPSPPLKRIETDSNSNPLKQKW